ncbi:MAG TPA: ribosome maturation factor RimM [Acidimicrobiales bacterium]|nr:ribosome maturation factor RimM [Acidimicrobiales bacterium]
MTQLEIGRIGKAHGLRGEVTAVISSDRPERTAPGAVWILDSGSYTVRAIRPFQAKWIAALDGVETREAAEALTGSVISGEPIDDDDALWAHELLGATVVTPDGQEWGSVAAIYPNPASDLIELADGTLIPTVFVTDQSGLPDRVVVDPPEGLLQGEPEEA